MTLAEKLSSGGMVAIIGIVTVFLVLIILWAILEVMHVIVAKSEKKTTTVAPQPAKAAPAPAAPAVAPINPADLAPLPQGDPREDKQFIAAVMGAIAAHDNADSFDYKIKSIKKL